MAKQKHEISEIENIHTLLNMWLKTLDKEENYWDGVCASDCQIAYRFVVKDENSFINWLSANWENLPNKACSGRLVSSPLS